MNRRYAFSYGKLRRAVRRHCGAFTLIEMLVVLAIIGILAGMILPALTRARETARRAHCMSNLNQIGLTMAQYTGACDDYLPSWACYGSTQGTVRSTGDINNPLLNYDGFPAGLPPNTAANNLSHHGVSRHMMVAYSFGFPQQVTTSTGQTVSVTNLAPYALPNTTPPQYQPNFMPVGLGILVARNYLGDVHVLDCPSMRSGATTYYDSPEANNQLQINEYTYDPAQWKKLVGSPALGTPEQEFLIGDGTQLFQTGQTAQAAAPTKQNPNPTVPSVVGLLSSYSYRDTPFYYDPNVIGGSDASGLGDPQHNPQNYPNQPDKWQCAVPLNSVGLPGGSPGPAGTLAYKGNQVFPNFMTPVFKTLRTLQARAICSDTFDYAWSSTIPTGFTQGGGLAGMAHKDGYNILYGDNHVKWYDDGDHQIGSFYRWNTTYNWAISNGDWNGAPAPTSGSSTALLGVDDLTISSPTSQQIWNLFDRQAGIDVGN